MSYRDQGTATLGTVLNQAQNIRIIEKHVYNISAHEAEDEEELEDMYRRNLYQTVGDILNGEKPKTILTNIKAGKIGWSHPSFKEMKNRMDEQDGFIENPIEVEKGVQQCKAVNKTTGKVCNSKRVIYYQRQERGSDEPMTTYNTCCACGAKWKYSG